MSRSKAVAPAKQRRQPCLPVLSCAVAMALGAYGAAALANPEGGVAVVGQATFNASQPNLLVVTTQNGAGTNHSAINWQSFSIPAGSTTRIDQPSASSLSINRVVTDTPSVLFGTLSSNGSVVLVNQAGIAVGTGALVDTAGFTASVVGMSDADALSGRLRFGATGLSRPTGALTVQGNIIARNGDVVLIAPTVDVARTAVVESQNGSVILAAGQSVEVTGRGLEGISMQVQAPTDTAVNLGTLKGDAVGIFAGTLRHSGLIQATTASLEGGKVMLKAAGDTYVEGEGKIIATGARGGSVQVLGQRVALLDSASIDASGDTSGGTVLIGGDYQGKNANVQNASMSYAGTGVRIKADANQVGQGGKVIVWADDTTRMYGTISAQGGAISGDGGFVEVSGKNYLDFRGSVSTRAANGKVGTLLLDPSNISIQSTTDSNINTSSPFISTADTSVLTDTTLLAALAANDVEVDATGWAGTVAGNISVDTPLTWSTHVLKLRAGSGGTISFNSNVTGNGGGGLALIAGTGGVNQTGSTSLTVDNLEVISSGDVVLGGGASVTVGTLAANLTGSAQLNFQSATSFTVATVGSTTGITAGSGSITLKSIGAGLTVNNAVSSSGNISLEGYSSVSLSGAGVSTSGGTSTLNVTSTMGPVNIFSGSYLSAYSTSISSGNGALLNASTLKVGRPGAIGSLSVSGNLTMQGGSTIAVDVASTSSFDSVTVSGQFNAASASETLSVTDLSGGTVSGALSSVISGSPIVGSQLLLSAPAGWSKTQTASLVSLNAVVNNTTSQQQLVGTTADFLAQFDALLLAQRDATLEQQRGKDLLVVEGDICRP